MDIYRYVDDDGTFGKNNGENEFCGYVDDDTLYSVWGYHWGTGIACTMITMCLFQPTCGRICETDVMWNPAYWWTNDADTAIGNPDVVLLRPVNMHELGHTLGLFQHVYGAIDNASCNVPRQKGWNKYENYKSCMNYRCAWSLIDYSDGSHGKGDFNDWTTIDPAFFEKTFYADREHRRKKL